jgi:hypothetical protein
LGQLPVAAIDAGLVMQVVDRIWAQKPKNGKPGPRPDRCGARRRGGAGLPAGRNPTMLKGTLAHILPARAKLRNVALPFDAA